MVIHFNLGGLEDEWGEPHDRKETSKSICIWLYLYNIYIHVYIVLNDYCIFYRYECPSESLSLPEHVREIHTHQTIAGWWFGPWFFVFFFPYIGNVIIPIDELKKAIWLTYGECHLTIAYYSYFPYKPWVYPSYVHQHLAIPNWGTTLGPWPQRPVRGFSSLQKQWWFPSFLVGGFKHGWWYKKLQ